MNVAAIIPSLNPDENFPLVVEQLSQAGFFRILVVDDGSDDAHRPLFERAGALPGCEVLRHEHNRGKGCAIKTALARYLEDPGGCIGAVTLDGDGQHSAADAVRCAEALLQHPNSLVLGVRDFAADGVPKRSALGNRFTRAVFFLLFGLRLSDTQTGLRGIPNAFAKELPEVNGDRYEFETNMLLEAKSLGTPFWEVPIETIYIDENASSHYRPVRDSLRIFTLIIKFALSGLSSAILDVLLFALLNWLLAALAPGLRYFVAVGGARACSAVYNFLVNKNIVFHSDTGYTGSFVRYAVLCVAQMLCSWGGTWFFSEAVGLPAVASKIVIDTVLFFVSFQIQRRWVFPRHIERKNPPSTDETGG